MTLDHARDVKMELLTASRQNHRTETESIAAGRRDHRQHVHEQKSAAANSMKKRLEDAHKTGVMFSLHVKATMMKVSHPIVFGHCRPHFLQGCFCQARRKLFEELGVNVNNGMVNLYDKIETLPASKREEIAQAICMPATNIVQNWRWSIRPRASPISIRLMTSSSMHRCLR